MKSRTGNLMLVLVTTLIGQFAMAVEGFAAEAESSLACADGPPQAIAYGDHTTGCAISVVTDIDQFSFTGSAGDHVRINVMSTSTNMDPVLEVRDSVGTLIASQFCTNYGCSFPLDIILPASGVYLITVFDSGTNETGDYLMQLERIWPPVASQRVDYDSEMTDEISPQTDIDHYHFYGTAGTSIRLNAFSTTTNMDPTIEVRDPNGTVVLNGQADGASCTNYGCTFSVDLIPALSGMYSLLIYDAATNEAGGYQLSLWCVVGACDSDGNGIPDADPSPISYDNPVTDSITPAVDGDFFTFHGTAGTSIRLNAFSTTTNMDPTIEVRDPNGTVVLNGQADGASCANYGCTFSVDLIPALSGTYSLLIYDAATNEAGGYQLSLWCIQGDCDGNGSADADSYPVLSYIESISDSIAPAVDGDFFTFHGTAGTSIRLNGFSTSTNMDPNIEVRDPNGTVVLNGQADGAGCTNYGCSFSVDLIPAVTGVYSLLIYDAATNEPGNYQLSLWCILGDCDSDADGFIDNDREVINYDGAPKVNDISPAVDADFYIFKCTAADQIRLNAFSATTNMDPTIELYDPNGTRILNGPLDGASCTNYGCSFAVDLSCAVTGTYSMVLYDLGTNEAGRYNLDLQCIFSPGDFTCDNITAPPPVCDNCTVAPNPTQLDANADGYGNLCDADLDDDGFVNFADLSAFKLCFGTTQSNCDFSGNGFVGFEDLSRFKQLFGSGPGPSCIAPNSP